ncbi:hypothetical protein JXA80_01500 [bacterium]|nr:hypothetical protein [candidate division CSSED10-310 bacterium]
MGELVYRILEQTRMISGRCHHLVERRDGFRFYLDDVFLEVLRHGDAIDLADRLKNLGVLPGDLNDILMVLGIAGLIPEAGGDADGG